jgi:hypothetical protein
MQQVTRDLAKSIREQNLGTIRIEEGPSQTGKKGDPVAIGNIVLALVGSGGVAVSLVQVLKAYVERKSSLSFELSRADGKKVALNAENLGSSQLHETSQIIEKFLKT